MGEDDPPNHILIILVCRNVHPILSTTLSVILLQKTLEAFGLTFFPLVGTL